MPVLPIILYMQLLRVHLFFACQNICKIKALRDFLRLFFFFFFKSSIFLYYWDHNPWRSWSLPVLYNGFLLMAAFRCKIVALWLQQNDSDVAAVKTHVVLSTLAGYLQDKWAHTNKQYYFSNVLHGVHHKRQFSAHVQKRIPPTRRKTVLYNWWEI